MLVSRSLRSSFADDSKDIEMGFERWDSGVEEIGVGWDTQ
jgi:hypothetical protein